MSAPTKFEFRFTDFNNLKNTELYALLKMRIDVFIIEQKSIYEELDNRDQEAIHLVACMHNDKSMAGSLRINSPVTADGPVQIGRVVVCKKYRGLGLAAEMMKQAMVYINSNYSGHNIELGAQSYLVEFYEKFSFKKNSEEYDDAGVPHIDMIYLNNERYN
ncbi:MAG: GNAT family N-acetyltransferase [Cohaesibacteraceae bacterium]|nr:GNAT family N-acetyltransferase [Cohaesibacteraceae bacterium]MBL4876942.1 GNAT family N-acetyltransferase [Cohaesibacteraceae bacterium]